VSGKSTCRRIPSRDEPRSQTSEEAEWATDLLLVYRRRMEQPSDSGRASAVELVIMVIMIPPIEQL
jgi:hypothetical protein